MSIARRAELPPDDLLTLLDRAVDVIAVVDVAGRIAYVNDTVSAVLAWERDDVVGRPALELVHPDDIPIAEPALAAELAGEVSLPALEVRIRGRNGSYLWFEVLAGGWIDAVGLRGLVINLRESTGRHLLAERAARRADLDGLVFDVSRRALDATLDDVKDALPAILARLGLLLRAVRAYAVIFDSAGLVGTNMAVWPVDDEVAGRAAGDTIALDRIPAVLVGLRHGDLLLERDIARPPAAWVREWYGVATPAAGAVVLCPLMVQGRLLGILAVEQDAEVHDWAHDELTAIRSVGEALAVALARDHDRRALIASEEHFRLIAENASDAITLLDADGRCTYASTSARLVLGIDPEQLIGADVFDHVDPDDRDNARRRLATFAAGDQGAIAITYRWRRPAGDVVWIENVYRAVRDPDGALSGIQGSARDVTARKAREDELAHRALHDPLTGVANRTLFDQRLAAADRARRSTGTSYAVLAIDLDGFKEVNDAFGHLEGDRALVEVASRLAASVRQADTVGRVGGDEFMVLCRDASADDAVALAERLVVALGQPVEVAGGQADMSASIGVAPADDAHPSMQSLLGAADQAMYEAKRAGKGRVRLSRQ